ncbi:hypothetical protein ABFA30_21765 [Pseudomonas sp. HLMP]
MKRVGHVSSRSFQMPVAVVSLIHWLTMLRILLLQKRFALSAPAMEEALDEITSMCHLRG